MNSLAVVEIAANSLGRLPAAMLEKLYRASEKGVIILVLNDTGYEAVDKVLDDVVASLPHSIPGVRYVDSTDDDGIRRACGSAPLVFWQTNAFRRQVTTLVGDGSRVFPVSRIEDAFECRSAAPRPAGCGDGREERPAAAPDRHVVPPAKGQLEEMLGKQRW